MSFLGNFAAAQSAKAIGKYNNTVYQQQADAIQKKKEQNKKIYNDITRPLFVKQQNAQYDQFFVNQLNTGFEMTGSAYLNALEFKYNQAFDLAVLDFNQEQSLVDQENQAQAALQRGQSALFEGNLRARTENIKGVTSLLSTANKQYEWV